MKLLAIICLVLCNFIIASAQARYFVIPVTASKLDTEKRTHVVISGRGNDLSTALQSAATAKIKKLRQIYPNDQVLFITTEENQDNASSLQRLGYKDVELKDAYLNLNVLMNELVAYKAIASLHVFSHSGVVAGMFLDRLPNDIDIRWLPQDPDASRIAHNFTSDAFATLNGCNAGHVHAPVLSAQWKIPVSGALASSHFESLYQNGKYYWSEKQNKSVMKACASSDCYRLRPDNANYNGYWGVFKQGLPFYKFFCAFDDQEKCLSAMAASIATNISGEKTDLNMSFEHYSFLVREWLCPSGRYPSTMQATCMATLAKLDLQNPERSYSPFLGGSAKCNFKACYEEPVCMFPDKKLCPLDPPLSKLSTTFVDEYLYYLKGYKYLKSVGQR